MSKHYMYQKDLKSGQSSCEISLCCYRKTSWIFEIIRCFYCRIINWCINIGGTSNVIGKWKRNASKCLEIKENIFLIYNIHSLYFWKKVRYCSYFTHIICTIYNIIKGPSLGTYVQVLEKVSALWTCLLRMFCICQLSLVSIVGVSLRWGVLRHLRCPQIVVCRPIWGILLCGLKTLWHSMVGNRSLLWLEGGSLIILCDLFCGTFCCLCLHIPGHVCAHMRLWAGTL